MNQGDVIELGQLALGAAEIIAFARAYDPQPQHVDQEAAKATMLGGLCASGWHTAAALNRMLRDGLGARLPGWRLARADEMAWKAPLYADAPMTVRATVEAMDDTEIRIAVTAEDGAGTPAATLVAIYAPETAA